MTWDGADYQRRFDELAASGKHLHGEADFVESFGPISVLDAGCGTGRVAIELARRGIEVVGADVDESMLSQARRMAPQCEWVLCDLAELDLGRTFDVVVMAGNVMIFTPPGTHTAVVAGCGRHLAPAGLLVAGFQLDRGYGLDDYDADCDASGLELMERHATWERDAYQHGDYAVSVHRRRSRH